MEKGWLLRIDETISFKLHRIIKELAIRKLKFNPLEINAQTHNIINRLSIDKSKDNPITINPVAMAIYLGYAFGKKSQTLRLSLEKVEHLSKEKEDILSKQNETL